jgi:hypothetical protein
MCLCVENSKRELRCLTIQMNPIAVELARGVNPGVIFLEGPKLKRPLIDVGDKN